MRHRSPRNSGYLILVALSMHTFADVQLRTVAAVVSVAI